jgi:hypothetical protein
VDDFVAIALCLSYLAISYVILPVLLVESAVVYRNYYTLLWQMMLNSERASEYGFGDFNTM